MRIAIDFDGTIVEHIDAFIEILPGLVKKVRDNYFNVAGKTWHGQKLEKI